MFYREQIINKTNIAAKSVLNSCIVFFLSTEKEITGSFFLVFTREMKDVFMTRFTCCIFHFVRSIN